MLENNLILSQRRGFGQVFNTALAFLKENLKGIFRAYIIVFGPFFVVSAVLLIIGMIYLQSGISASQAGEMDSSHPLMISSMINTGTGLMLLGGLMLLLMFCVASIIIYSYMRQYEELGKDAITIAAIWKDIRRKSLPMIGGFFFIGIGIAFLSAGLVLIGSIMVFALSVLGPGGMVIGILLIYVPVIMIMGTIIMYVPCLVIGDLDLFSAITRMFVLYGNWKRWLQTIGIVVVMYVMNYILSTAMSLSAMLGIGAAGLTPHDFTSLSDWYMVYLGSTMLLFYLAVSFFLVVVSQVITGIQYYNLAEAVDHTGSQRMIDQIGQDV